jgi:hypothetical protein
MALWRTGDHVRCLAVSLAVNSLLTLVYGPLRWENVRPSGFEPETCGLRVRCSAVELEARPRV